MAQKILIAGGSGFIGSHIVAELWKAGKSGQSVHVLTRNPASAKKKLHGIEIEYVKGDVRNPESLAKAVDGFDTVICCVQFPGHPVENPKKGYTYEKYDAEGTENLVRACVDAGTVRHFIYLSGAGVRDERTEPWFRAKYRAEAAVINSGIPYTIFRPSWVYGRDDRSLNRFVFFAKNLPAVPVIGDGTNRVQPLFIMDLAAIIAKSVSLPRAQRRIYDVGGPETLTMDEIVRTILDVLHKRKPIVHQPTWLMKLATRPLGLLPNAPLTPQSIDFILMEELVDNSDVVQDFKIDLTRLSDALATYL